MKILIVSLLRLGDLIQQIPLIKGLRNQYPQAEIHILINKQFSHSNMLLDKLVDRVHQFDREKIQKGIGEAGFNILWSYDLVKSQVEDLKSSSFDIVYNFTHTKLSAYIIGLLGSPVKGLSYSNSHFLGLDNSWIQYFNDRFSGTEKSLFHYVEVLSRALDIPVEKSCTSLPFSSSEKLILMQCLTSDSKKNWGLKRFNELKIEIERSLVDYKVKILGAYFERQKLQEYFKHEDLLICDLSEAQEHLKRARLLITGDTSIKHLAAQMGTPIVELVLGSSDFNKTRAFTDSSLPVKAQVPCAPCMHSVSCPKSSHLCADDITIDRAFTAVWKVLSKEPFLRIHSERMLLDREVWQQYLEGSQKSVSSLKLTVSTEILTSQVIMENTLRKIQSALSDKNLWNKRDNLGVNDIGDLIICAQDILKSDWDQQSGYFSKFIEALTSSYKSTTEYLEKIQSSFVEASAMVHLRRCILNQNSQEGQENAKRTEQLFAEGSGRVGTITARNPKDAGL